MRKRIKCKKKSGKKQTLTATEKILFFTAVLNYFNAVMNVALTIVTILMLTRK